MRGKYRPSDYLPEFLREDLRVDTLAPNPLIAALDRWADHVLLAAHQQGHRTIPQRWRSEHCRHSLKASGFRVDQLDDHEVHQLFALRTQLQKLRGTLAAVHELGTLYFGILQVQRGYTHRGKQILAPVCLPLQAAEFGSTERVVVAVVPASACETRVQEFRFNAEHLLPDDFRLRIFRTVPKAEPSRRTHPFGSGIRLERRRL